jgi:hypothetical protein
MTTTLKYKIKVYGKGATFYPTETYEPKSRNQAKNMFSVMKKLDPYIGCNIDVIEYVYVDGKITEHNYIYEK